MWPKGANHTTAGTEQNLTYARYKLDQLEKTQEKDRPASDWEDMDENVEAALEEEAEGAED